MKATDLMIGDWVSVVVQWKPDIKYMYGEVSELLALDGYLKVRQSYDPYHDNEIYCICDTEPIPLTPEILKKNGFETLWEGSDYWYDAEYGNEICFIPSERTHIMSDDSDYGVYIHIKFVHELQHALRLCGIEKEIII